MATFTHWIESITASTDCHALPHHQTTIFSSLTSRPLDRKRFRINGLPYLVATSTHWIESVFASRDCHIQQPPPVHWSESISASMDGHSSHLCLLDRKRYRINELPYLVATSVYWLESFTPLMDCHIKQPPPPIGQKALPHQWTAIFVGHLHTLDRKFYRIN